MSELEGLRFGFISETSNSLSVCSQKFEENLYGEEHFRSERI